MHIVFGATGGVGSALCQRLVQGDTPVLAVSRNDTELHASKDMGCQVLCIDLTDHQQARKALREAVADTPVTSVTFAVGSIDLKPFDKATLDDFTTAINLNVFSAINAVQALAPNLVAGSASIVFFSTIAARKGYKSHAVIATAKAALEGLTVSLAADLAPDVRVNCIAPSLMDTKIAQPIIGTEKMRAGIASKHPLKRIGCGTDAAALAEFLIDDAKSSWITGQVLHLDGGYSTIVG